MPKINVLRRGRTVFTLFGSSYIRSMNSPTEVSSARLFLSVWTFWVSSLGSARWITSLDIYDARARNGAAPGSSTASRRRSYQTFIRGRSSSGCVSGRSFLSRRIEQVRREEHEESALPPRHLRRGKGGKVRANAFKTKRMCRVSEIEGEALGGFSSIKPRSN